MSTARFELFVVKHYEGDTFPTIKGNGFDGLQVGEDREEANEFIGWVNDRISALEKALRASHACCCRDCADKIEALLPDTKVPG